MKVAPAKGPDGKAVPMPPAPSIGYFLSLTASGTFHTDIKGTPDKKVHTSDGTWKLANGKITLYFLKRDGKPDTSEPRTRVLAVSKDGKSLTTVLEGQMQVRGPKGETKLPKGFTPPKVTLTFTRN